MNFMKWVVRFFAVIGLYYGGLMLAGMLGIGHAFFYYGSDPVQVLNDDNSTVYIVERPNYNKNSNQQSLKEYK